MALLLSGLFEVVLNGFFETISTGFFTKNTQYMAANNRISWKESVQFNYSRKVFAFSNWPDVLGYCGDVLFPSIALNQIVELADVK